MTSTDPIARALILPAGAVFHRCALQVNPHHYGATFRGQAAGGDENTHAADIVEKALEVGVSVLAITDHNDVSGVPAFRSAAAGRDLHIFPGFELSSSEGIHVLCIYPQEVDQKELERFLGEFGIRNPKPSSDLSEPELRRDPKARARARRCHDRRSCDDRERTVRGSQRSSTDQRLAGRRPARHPDPRPGR